MCQRQGRGLRPPPADARFRQGDSLECAHPTAGAGPSLRILGGPGGRNSGSHGLRVWSGGRGADAAPDEWGLLPGLSHRSLHRVPARLAVVRVAGPLTGSDFGASLVVNEDDGRVGR